MFGRRKKLRGMPQAAAVATLVAASFAIVTSPAAVSAQAAGPYGGSASADLLHLTALDIPGTVTVADLGLAPARSDVLSTGLPGGARSSARATNVDIDVASGQLPIPGLLVEAAQTAPPDNAQPAEETLIPLDISPVADVGVGNASAHARWLSDTECVPPGTPISASRSSLADVRVLPFGTLIPGGSADTSIVSLVNDAGGTVFTETSAGLFSTSGTTAGFRSTATTQVTGVILFAGTPFEITINVVAPPVVTAEATGQAGGARVTYSQPVLQVQLPAAFGGQQFTLDANSVNQTVEIPLLLTLELGTLTQTVAADGTSAEGQADLLRISLLESALFEAVDLSIGAGSVSAQVPVGGVSCDNSNPLRETHKDLSAVNVGPGQTFTYTVTVPNRGECTLTNVSIVDQVTGPAGASIVTTDPPGTVDGLKVTWQVASIAPNETKTFQITVRAPDAVGAKFSNHVDATGTCDGRQVTQPADVDGPTVVAPSGPCRLSTSNKAASHLEVMPGQTFNYYIHAYNSGGQTCTDVTVTDTLEGPIDFVSCTDACQREGTRVTWGLGNLAPGQSRTVAVTVQARADAPQGQNLPDAARITSGPGGNGPSADVRTDGPVVSTRSVLAPPSPAGPGGPVAVTALPRTGATVPLAAGVLLTLGLAVTALRRRIATT